MIETSIWPTKIRNAEKYYKLWADRFKCEILEDYWEGYQWRQIVDIPYYRPYVVNLIYAELKKKLANMLYQNIEYNLTPRPGNYAGNPEFAFQTASFKQDFLNEIVARANKDQGFNEQVKLAAMDSYFRFGVIEIDYAADWRNPAKKPLITSEHDEPDADESSKDAKKVSDLEVPFNERIYFKRIKASRFRVAVSDDSRLENCSWCGYYSYIYKHVLFKNKKLFDLPSDFDALDVGISSEYIGGPKINTVDTNRAGTDSKDLTELYKSGKIVKAWRIWDNETNRFHLILEPNYVCIYEDDFENLPFATHRHDFRFDGWYPIPPVYQWLSSQDEINQAREQMRNYRRRFTRKFKYWGMDQEELEKFKSETDGEVIKLKNPNSIIEPIGNPEIGISIQDALNAGRDDFNVVSGSSADLSTAQSDRTTATQSKITAMKAQVIESVEQVEFEHFYHKIGRLALLKAQTKFTSGIWVKNSLDPGETFLQQIDPKRLLPIKYITIQDLDDGFDVDVVVSCVNASPQKMQEEFEKYVKFLTIVMQFPMIAMSPVLIREAAFRIGYHNEKVIAEMQRTALLHMMGQIAQQAQQTGQDPQQMIQAVMGNQNGAQGNMLRNAAPGSQEVIDQQLIGQVGQ